MCVVSMVAEDWSRRWPQNPNNPFPPGQGVDLTWPSVLDNTHLSTVTRSEFDALKREIEALKELLKAAKIYDEVTGQPNCEKDEKIALLKKLAELVGVDLKEAGL